ncbi:MAG: vWA domain-containing protein [Akkermansiaceae bacterium]
MRRPSRQLNIFSISTLDLFASAMGAFVIIAVILFPYYLKNGDIMEKARIAEAKLKNEQQRSADLQRAKQEAEEEVSRLKPKDLEIVFVCDTTSSMQSHIDGIKNNLKDVVDILKIVNSRIRIGFVAYRDEVERGHAGTYVTKSFQMREMTDASFRDLNRFVDSLQAYSAANRDKPESVDIGLSEARKQPWSGGDWKHIIVVITDASAKREARALSQASTFSNNSRTNKGRKVTTILAKTQSMDPAAPRFLRKLASQGGGEYVEDSGRMLNSLIRATLAK